MDENRLGRDPIVMVTNIENVLRNWDAAEEGAEIYETVSQLFPVCRSITGDGLRQSLRTLEKYVPLSLREVPTGRQVFDWSVPNEWNIRDAWIKSARGEKIVDFRKCNLHVVNYSMQIRQKMRLEELRKHLFTLPE